MTTPALRVAVLVPCFNEEAAVATVVSDFRKALPTAGIIVVDENLSRRQRLAEVGDHGGDRGFLIEARHQNRNPQRRCRHRGLTESSLSMGRHTAIRRWPV